MRGAAFASIALALLMAGCAEPAQDDWEPYEDGRGLAFGMLLGVLLIVGVVLLIVNLTAGRQAGAVPMPPTAPDEPPSAAVVGGWEPVEPEPSTPAAPRAPARRPAAKPAAKSSKPRRRAP